MHHTVQEYTAEGTDALQLRPARGRVSQAALSEGENHGPIPLQEVQKLTQPVAGQNSV